MPDVESVVRLSVLFQTSLEELLLEKGEEADFVEKKGTQITLEDMVRINTHNRRMNLLLCSGFLFLAIGILLTGFERMLESAAVSLEYILYRYMVTGNYEAAPMNYGGLLIPAILAGAVGVVLCLCYIWGSMKR